MEAIFYFTVGDDLPGDPPKQYGISFGETSNQTRRSVSLLLWEKGDHEVVDEELVKIQDTSSVSLRLPPSPTGEGLGYARRNDAAHRSLFGTPGHLAFREPRRPIRICGDISFLTQQKGGRIASLCVLYIKI